MHANHAAHNTRAGRDRIQARALQHQQAQQAQQQQHSSTLAKEQPKLSTVESASKPGQQAYAAESTGEGRSLEALSRQVSNIQQDGKGEKNEAQKAIAANAARADHQQADNSRQGETGRTDSRFAWSNPNSWASKVAGGGRGGESGGNSGVAGGVAGSASSAAGGSVDK